MSIINSSYYYYYSSFSIGFIAYLYLLLLIIATIVLYLTYQNRRLRKLAKQFPGPPTLPLVGNGLEFIGSPQDVMKKIIKIATTYEAPFRVWVGPFLLIAVVKPEDLQVVLNSSKSLEKNAMYRFFMNTVGEGLFSAPVEKWRKHRRAITPAFNTNLLEQFIPVFNEKNRILIKRLNYEAEKSSTFDMWNYIAPTALDIICETTMGYKLATQENTESEFADSLIKASEFDCMRIYKPWLHPEIIFKIYSYITGLQQVYKTLHKLPAQVIQEKKEEYRKFKESEEYVDKDGKKRQKAFLDTLLELNEKGAEFTDTEMMDEVITMMIGGSETSALTNCFTLLMLAMHPQIQDQVYEEVFRVFGTSDRDVLMEDLVRLELLERCIKETLRIFPVGPLFLRQTKQDIKLKSKDVIIPAGASIIIPPIITHRDSTLYPNPMVWNPDNFLPEAVEKRHRYSFIAFSGGPRGCIGSKYALLSMKVLISWILRNFCLTTQVRMQDIELKVDLLMRSVDGYQIKLHKRTL